MNKLALVMEGIASYLGCEQSGESDQQRWDRKLALARVVKRAKREDEAAWDDFVSLVNANQETRQELYIALRTAQWCIESRDGHVALSLPAEMHPLSTVTQEQILEWANEPSDTTITNGKRTRLVYLETKPGLSGNARICRVTISASGKTIYHEGRTLKSLKGGYKANFFDIDSELRYWISNCKKNGQDSLYPSLIEVDANACEEYWVGFRGLPDKRHVTRFRSEGKYSKRRPS